MAHIPVWPTRHHPVPGLDLDPVLEETPQGGNRPGTQPYAGSHQDNACHGSASRRPSASAAATDATRQGRRKVLGGVINEY
jgi:hypothetical protein